MREQKPSGRTPRRPPIWLIGISGLIILAMIVLHQFELFLSDNLMQFDSGLAEIFSYALAFGGVLLWTVWAFFFSGWTRLITIGVPVALLLGLIAFFACFQPVLSGNLGIARFEPRFWGAPGANINPGIAVDLQTTTPTDFPQFLGPQRNAMLPLLEPLPFDQHAPTKLWTIDVGKGWSGFSAVNGFGLTMEQLGDEECVRCYRLDNGQLCWSYAHQRRHENPLGGVGPRSTPTVTDGKVYALGATGVLVCLEGNTGNKIWSVDLLDELKIESVSPRNGQGFTYQVEQSNVMWGRAASPLVYQNLVIVPGGGPADGPLVSLIAFNKDTGERVWQGGKRQIGYGSPSIARIGGQDQILIVNESAAVGHDPATGAELWSYGRFGNSSGGANTSQVTVVSENQLLLTKGYGLGAELIEVWRDDQEAWKVRQLWQNPRVLKTKLTNPVIKDQFAYALSDGILECVDLADGARKWKQGRFGHGQLLLLGGVLMVHSEEGQLTLVRASPDGYEEMGSVDTIAGVCWNTICFSGDLVVVRSDLQAACFRVAIRSLATGQDKITNSP